MNTIDVNRGSLQEVEIKGYYGVFTEFRVDKSTIPEGLNCYELRHGEDDGYPASLEENVTVNYFGAVLMTEKLQLGKNNYIELSADDFNFTGEDMSISVYMSNYFKIPTRIAGAKELVQFMKQYEPPFKMTLEEAGVLINYLEEDGYVLGQENKKLFRGVLADKKNVRKWQPDTIDDAVVFASDRCFDLLQYAGAELEECENDKECEAVEEKMKPLREDYMVLDALYDRTKYGREIEECAKEIAQMFIEAAQSEEELDDVIETLREALREENAKTSGAPVLADSGGRKAR